jgi:hypothetical protein
MNAMGARLPLRLSALLLFAAACAGGPSPTPTPSDLSAVLAALALRGTTLHQAVSGDAGCPGSGLHSNAARLELSAADGEDHVVYLFRWRRAPDFEAAGDRFAQCVRDFEAATGTDALVVEASPWRAYGPGWSEEFADAVEGALRAAGGG